ncbi:MAG: carbohydrate binding domain-containing protein, partial [Chloroflexota bacterium]|nr:carbohydrate binding domain-containing protein [Chloroflexota bacterium]
VSNSVYANNLGDHNSDGGGNGIVVKGDYNEVANNTVSNHYICSPFYGTDGSGIEVFGGKYNLIHHNFLRDNRTAVELGNKRSSDNTVAYNLVTLSRRYGAFLSTKGPKSTYGPVYRTNVLNNTAYLVGARNTGVGCSGGCGMSILNLRNNIIWAEAWTVYADAPFAESNNIYWSSDGTPSQYTTISSTSKLVDPGFLDRTSGDFRLRSNSKAINGGSIAAVDLRYKSDMNGVPLYQGPRPDIGAYEYRSAPSAYNILSNPSFDLVSSSWPSPWYFSASSGRATIARDSTITVAGPYSARIAVAAEATGSRAVQIRQPVSLSRGRSYTLDLYARASTPQTVTVVVQRTTSPYTIYKTHQISIDTSWHRFRWTYRAMANQLYVAVRYYTAGELGKVWFDRMIVG